MQGESPSGVVFYLTSKFYDILSIPLSNTITDAGPTILEDNLNSYFQTTMSGSLMFSV